ncbi:MAG: YveK family protein [Symbiobacteriia bacterium]
MELEQEIDLRQLFGVVRRRFWIVAVLTLTAVLVSGIASVYFIAPTYTASVTMLVAKRDAPVADYSTLLLNQNLVRTYAEIAKSRSIAGHVVESLNLKIPVETMQKRINVAAVKDTQVIRISVDGATPQEAQAAAIAVSSVFIDQVKGLMKVENVAVIDPAEAPTDPTKPRPLLNVAVAGVLAVMLGFGLMFLLEYLDNTIKTHEDVARYLGLPVLGTIPLIDLKDEDRRDAGLAVAQVASGAIRPVLTVDHSDKNLGA